MFGIERHLLRSDLRGAAADGLYLLGKPLYDLQRDAVVVQ